MDQPHVAPHTTSQPPTLGQENEKRFERQKSQKKSAKKP